MFKKNSDNSIKYSSNYNYMDQCGSYFSLSPTQLDIRSELDTQ